LRPTQARTIADETNARAADATANALVREWRVSIGLSCANAIDNLKKAGSVDVDRFNNIILVFNWFKDLAEQVTNKSATDKIIKNMELKRHACEFCTALDESVLSGNKEQEAKLKELQGELKKPTLSAFIGAQIVA
jgi:hypothetical protein